MGELCLIRGMDDACLLSMAASNGTCLIKLGATPSPVTIACTIDLLEGLVPGRIEHLAGPTGFCELERDVKAVRFRIVGTDGPSATLEVDLARFDAAVVMLNAGRHADVLATVN